MSGLSRLLRCGDCGASVSCGAYLDNSEFSRDLRDELLSDDVLVSCLFCDGGVMTLDGNSFSKKDEPDIWGFF